MVVSKNKEEKIILTQFSTSHLHSTIQLNAINSRSVKKNTDNVLDVSDKGGCRDANHSSF